MDDKSLIQSLGMLGDCLGGMSINDAADRIERHETAGAAATSRLPKPKPDEREAWEALGVVFGDEVDDLFVAATLPDGWKVEPTDHSMWNAIVDAAGNERGKYFYKGSFWDRSAFLGHPHLRFGVAQRYPKRDGERRTYEEYERKYRTITIDVEDRLNPTPLASFTRTVKASVPEPNGGEGHRAFWDEHSECKAQANAAALFWLDEHKPQWRDPSAYWPAVEE